jgi:hypothetical protein
MLVRIEVSVVRARAASGGRSMRKRLTNSAARCWASAALPPLPKNRTLRPAVRAAAVVRAAARMDSALASTDARFTRRLSSRISVTSFR